MAEDRPAQREAEELEEQEIEGTEAELLPDREAMSILNPDPQPLPE